METLSDYFYLSSLNTPADYMIFGAAILFLVGFISIFFDPLRIQYRSRYYFYASILLFVLAVYLGWNDLDEKVKILWDSL